MIENIVAPQPWLRVFPDAASVFTAADIELQRHLHPLVSIELSVVNPAWSGWIHLISPIEPYEAYMGDHTTPFHNEYTRENWIAFRLDDEGRYRFLGDRRYFFLETDHSDTASDWLRPELEQHYQKQQSSFEAAIHRFHEYGGLYQPRRFKPLEKAEWATEPTTILDQVGGTVGSANWTGYPPIPSAFALNTEDDDNVFPTMANGDRFHFIAGVPGYHYRDSGADWILLFYEPVSRTALLTFDWT
jgi:hypothetical protein